MNHICRIRVLLLDMARTPMGEYCSVLLVRPTSLGLCNTRGPSVYSSISSTNLIAGPILSLFIYIYIHTRALSYSRKTFLITSSPLGPPTQLSISNLVTTFGIFRGKPVRNPHIQHTTNYLKLFAYKLLL